MGSITLLYYTANLIPESFAKNVREHLLKVSLGKPIISISQKPLDFGENIHLPGLVPCTYNVYQQILIGAERAQTEFVACCEDDTVYCEEHFNFTPSEDAFYYNVSHWHVRPKWFYFRGHRIMSQCIVPTDLLIKTLNQRFEKFPDNDSILRGFGEPGRAEHLLGLPPVKSRPFHTVISPLTFRHRISLSSVRNVPNTARQVRTLPPWGDSEELWRKFDAPIG